MRRLIPFLLILLLACDPTRNPQGLFMQDPQVASFLEEYPDADIIILHYTKDESMAESVIMKEVCGKGLSEAKDIYKAEIKASGLNLIAYLDYKTGMMECVRKFGTEQPIIPPVVPDKPLEPTLCPKEVTIDFSKDTVKVDETFTFTISALGDDGNMMPDQEINVIPYQDGEKLEESSVYTDDTGFFDEEVTAIEGEEGIYEMVAYISAPGCPYVSDVGYLSIIKGEPFRTLRDTSNCPTEINIEFDKSSYNVGEEITIEVELRDKANDRIPNREFTISASSATGFWDEQVMTTPDSGKLKETFTLTDSDMGDFVYKAYVVDPNCPYVVDTAVVHVGEGFSPQSGMQPPQPHIPQDPTQQTGQSDCPGGIGVEMDKYEYAVGDKINMKIEVLDMQGNPYPYQPFTMTSHGTDTFTQASVNAQGYYEESEVVTVPGSYAFEFTTAAAGCDAVTTTYEIEVKDEHPKCWYSPYYENNDCKSECKLSQACQKSSDSGYTTCYECADKCLFDEFYNDDTCANACVAGVNKCNKENNIPCYRCKDI